MPPTTKQTNWIRVLRVAIAKYTAIFQRVGAAHHAADIKIHPQHEMIWPLMGLVAGTGASGSVLDDGGYLGMCAGLSNLWIYYQNFFQDGIYAGPRAVNLLDVFNAETMNKRVTRVAVHSSQVGGAATVTVASTAQNVAGVSLGIAEPRKASGQSYTFTEDTPPEKREKMFSDLRSKGAEFSLLADALEQVHAYGNTSSGRETPEQNAKRMKAEITTLLARFACAPAKREKEIGRPWSGVGSFLRNKRFYTLSSGSHAMALSTYKTGVLFYDPNVGQLCIPSLGAAPAFFGEYFTAIFEATNEVKRDNTDVAGAPTDLGKKKLTIVEWQSTRPGKA